MALPSPTGYTLSYISRPASSAADDQTEPIFPANSYVYYTSGFESALHQDDYSSLILVQSAAANTNDPTAIGDDGKIYCISAGGSSSSLLQQFNPGASFVETDFDLGTAYNWKQQTFSGHTVSTGANRLGKTTFSASQYIIAKMNWTASGSNTIPPPIVGLINLSGLTSAGSYNMVVPVGTPANYFFRSSGSGTYLVNIGIERYVVSDNNGHAYILARIDPVGSSTQTYQWWIYKIDLIAFTATVFQFTGDATVGQGTAILYDSASNSLLVQSSTGTLFVVDCSTGSITNTINSFFTGNLEVAGTVGQTANGAFFSIPCAKFYSVSPPALIGTFAPAGVDFTVASYDPVHNYILAGSTNNYPPAGTTRATLVYKLTNVVTASAQPVVFVQCTG